MKKLLFTALFNSCLKYALDLPRPIIAMPDLPMLPLKSPGFPSGAAQVAFLFGALLMYSYRNYAAYFLGIFYICLLSFSRLYLGVHYPLDILGGWIAGCITFFLFLATQNRLERLAAKNKVFVASWVILIALLSVIYPLAGGILTMTLGAFIGINYHLYANHPTPLVNQVLKGLQAGTATLLFCFLIEKITPFSIQPLCIGLWISLGNCLLFFPSIRRN